MTIHIAEAWKACDAVTLGLAARFPEATFTCVRDIYGRCSFAVEKVSLDEVQSLKVEVEGNDDIRPYLGTMGVQLLQEGSSLAKIIHDARRPLDGRRNAFIVERLLSNESWIREPDSNPEAWPPVVAFYSFKGGVGRSTAAAMTALTLAREGKRVVVIDLDLEAPGIEGYFFAPGDANGAVNAGVVDYLLERGVLGAGYQPDINDFVLPYSDPAIAATGGSLLVVPAGRVDATYMERLGRVNLADIGRKHGEDNPLRALIAAVLAWRTADLILVDCRTGFTDLGGITLNGLSKLDVLVFRGGEADRRYLPVVLRHIQRFRETTERTAQVAEQLARSFLIAYTMVELPAKLDETDQYLAELRRSTGEAVWENVLAQFEGTGYAYPSDKAQDSPLEAVPHDVILIPYLKDFFMVGGVSDMLRLQAERPERPYDALVRRLMDVKLAPPGDRTAPPPVRPALTQLSDRERVLDALKQVTESPAGEQEFVTLEDFQHRFLPRAAYRTLLDPKAFLVLGRKGTGKSALFKILTESVVAKALARHLGLDSGLIEKTRWEVGFAASTGFPVPDHFRQVLAAAAGDPDQLSNFWRALAAFRLSIAFDSPIAGLSSLEDCITKLGDDGTQTSVRQWLVELNNRLEQEDQYCCVSHDDLDTGLTRDGEKRGILISALVEHWQQSVRRLPRIRAKIFLREDIWNREVNAVTDKAKVRDGIDRGTITWDGPDIYRAVLKRLGHATGFQEMLKRESLWNPEFDQMLKEPLGFIPPEDEDWIKKCINLLAGNTMAPGPSGHKKGYVYSWVLQHVADGENFLRPRNALLLFSEAAKLQGSPAEEGALLNPWRFMDALRGSVSTLAVADLRAEFNLEWSVGTAWLPDRFVEYEHIWPVSEAGLVEFLRGDQDLDRRIVAEKIEHMCGEGLLKRRGGRGSEAQLQIPDIYLFGLRLTRRG